MQKYEKYFHIKKVKSYPRFTKLKIVIKFKKKVRLLTVFLSAYITNNARRRKEIFQ